MNKKVISTFTIYNQAVLEFNEHHTGQKLFPLDEEVPLSNTGERMQDLHHRLFASHTGEVVVEVLEDGTLRVKKDQSNLYNE